MMETEKKDKNELVIEEVNLYNNVDCGKLRYACITDCITMDCWLTCAQ